MKIKDDAKKILSMIHDLYIQDAMFILDDIIEDVGLDRKRYDVALQYLYEEGLVSDTPTEINDEGEPSGGELIITNKGIKFIEKDPQKSHIIDTHKLKLGPYEFTRTKKVFK